MKTLVRPVQASRQDIPASTIRNEPMHEGRVLSPDEAKAALLSLSRRNGESLANRFLSARERLESEFGAHIEIVERPCDGRSVSVRFGFMTLDRTLDADKADMAFMAGFMLFLRSRPMLELPPEERYEPSGRHITREILLPPGHDGVAGVWMKEDPVYELRMERCYVLTERRYASADLARAAQSAEALLELIESRLMIPKMHQDLPDNVVPISQRPPRPKMESGVFDAPGAVRSQVS
jgi:hypothetical protein